MLARVSLGEYYRQEIYLLDSLHIMYLVYLMSLLVTHRMVHLQVK